MGAVENLLLRSAFNLRGFRWVIDYLLPGYSFFLSILKSHHAMVCPSALCIFLLSAEHKGQVKKQKDGEKKKNEKFHTSCSCRFFSCAKNGILMRQWTSIWNVKNATEKPIADKTAASDTILIDNCISIWKIFSCFSFSIVAPLLIISKKTKLDKK